MRWIQACRRQGYWLVGPHPTTGIAAQTQGEKCALDRRIVIVGVRFENLFQLCIFNLPTPFYCVTQ